MLFPVLLLSLAGATPAPSPSAPPPPCAAPEHRQLDFWVGDWDVSALDGTAAGRDTITREYGGCVVVERWTGLNGYAGSSFNVFEPATGKWHQVWVDNGGLLLQLRGAREGDTMVLEGDVPVADGTIAHHDLRIQELPDGRVRHRWRATRDGGKTWTVLFDGYFVRRK